MFLASAAFTLSKKDSLGHMCGTIHHNSMAIFRLSASYGLSPFLVLTQNGAKNKKQKTKLHRVSAGSLGWNHFLCTGKVRLTQI